MKLCIQEIYRCILHCKKLPKLADVRLHAGLGASDNRVASLAAQRVRPDNA
jgi:hypothetical protein